MLAGMLGSPALLGVAVGSYEAATRQGITSSDDELTGTVCDLDYGQGHLADEPTALSADPRLLEELGVPEGGQIRVARDSNEYAIYTVLEARPEAPNDIVRMGDEARCRLDLAGQTFPGVEQDECPGPGNDCSIVEDEFDADLSATVVDPEQSVEDARENGGFVERLDERGSDTLILAPHGGGIEPKTDEQAAIAGEEAGLTTWRAMGWRVGGGSFTRYRVPSRLLDPASFPELAEIADERFENAVSFNGLCEEGIEVGGNASTAFKQVIADAINDALPTCAVVAEPVDDFTSDDLLVNRFGDQGVFISQSWNIRRAYAERVARGVASVFDESIHLTTQRC